jgi:lipopolysaccharide/colanic/teichoic acid biosynthesis glycosyltransferase
MNVFMQSLTETVTLGSLGLAAYHHVGYPALLRLVRKPTGTPTMPASSVLPSVTIVMPAYNEADYIAAKLRNIAALDYPAHRLQVIIICDGCTDATAALARATLAETTCKHLDAAIVDHDDNHGKVAALNEGIPMAGGEIVVLSDVSAMLPADALRRAVAHFADPQLGAVGGTYRLQQASCDGEATYWTMQLGVKRGEAALGAPLGLHGAFYAFRRVAWAPLQADTINDDFVLPMQIFGRGWRVAYDDQIVAVEAERADPALEFGRRRRIAAGNTQQLLRMASLLHPRHGGVAFAFASGKALRVLMPLLIIVGLLGSLELSRTSDFFASLAAVQVLGLLAAVVGALLGAHAPKPLALAHYVVAGHLASLDGVRRYATGECRQPWQRASAAPMGSLMHLPRSVAFAKRTIDIVVASLALAVSLPAWPLIALAIRLESKGPVLFSQLRVGRALPDRTELFRMLKFRSMRSDAEARSGAVWATRDDPRITRVGRFLRKTRLDEIPQLINVLLGDMAIVGPRPERPGFYGRLETAIPFFADRTVGLRPGITGLAQVNQGYDTSIDDVRRKVTFDHAYAMRLVNPMSWLRSDLGIMARTVTVMATGRGQ